MPNSGSELRYAVRPRILLKYFGQLCLVLAVLSLGPLVVSLVSGEHFMSAKFGGVLVGFLAIWGSLAWMRAPRDLQTNEGIVLVAAIFLFAPLVLAYPLTSAGLSYVDALFEAISGVTTTGLTMTNRLVEWPATLLFTRAWMQWFGGLGIAALSVALITQPGQAAMRLNASEGDSQNSMGGARAYARQLLKVYLAVTVIGIGGALLTGMRPYDAFLYVLAAVSTGGFASHSGSLAGVGLAAQAWIILLCVAGAMPLAFYSGIFTKRLRIATDWLQVRAILISGVVLTVALGLVLHWQAGMRWQEAMHQAPILGFSAQSTAGFSAMSCAHIGEAAKLVVIVGMLTGGSLGSTAGGIKWWRLLIAATAFRLLLNRAGSARHAIVDFRLGGRRLDESEVRGALLLILLFAVMVILSWLAFLLAGSPRSIRFLKSAPRWERSVYQPD